MIQPLVMRTKRWSKRPLTAMLLAGGYYRWRRARLPHDRAVILIYHHVTGRAEGADRRWAPFQRGVPQARFDRQMRFLRRAMTPVPLREVVAAVRERRALPPRAVAVTFDDGYSDNFTAAYPILKKYDIPATVFVSTAFIESSQAFWWDQVYAILRHAPGSMLERSVLTTIAGSAKPRYPLTSHAARAHAADDVIALFRDLPIDERRVAMEKLRCGLGLAPDAAGETPPMMTWADLREMSRNGVAIESHTHTHPILGLNDADVVEEELATSKRLIEKHVEQPVEGLAYPDGRRGTYGDDTKRIAQATGFRFGCIAEPTRVGPGTDLFSLGRMPLGNVPFPVFVRDLLVVYAATGDRADSTT